MAALAVAGLLTAAGTTFADPWNDKTILTFSEAVMVPGATLDPGTYVFRLVDLRANRHTVRIYDESEQKVIATAHAIPVKRLETEGTTTLTFGATEAGVAPALKAWYYPGTLYGHEFIYSSDEAKKIAAREKTIVLSDDATRESSDADSRGSLRVYDAQGSVRDWTADEAVLREWHDWTQRQPAVARSVTDLPADDEERRDATAPMMAINQAAMEVSVDELEDDADRYTGKKITVSGEVEKVLGPRVFTIDEPNWADLGGEVLVHMPTALATLVRPDDMVTVTGTVREFVQAEFEDDWSWFGETEGVEAEFSERPVLVATRVTGGDSDRALFIARPAAEPQRGASERRESGDQSRMPDANRYGRDASERDMNTQRQPVTGDQRTTDRSASAVMEDDPMDDTIPVSSVSDITDATIGRTVAIEDVRVEQIIPGRGFLVTAEGTSVFVQRADGREPQVQQGSAVSIDGFVLTMPPAMRDHFRGMAEPDADVYIYATEVS